MPSYAGATAFSECPIALIDDGKGNLSRPSQTQRPLNNYNKQTVSFSKEYSVINFTIHWIEEERRKSFENSHAKIAYQKEMEGSYLPEQRNHTDPKIEPIKA
jgi:hypothetical protein